MNKPIKTSLTQKNFLIYSRNKNIINKKIILARLWELTIIINIIKITKTAANSINYRRILKINTIKNVTYLFIILKIININIY